MTRSRGRQRSKMCQWPMLGRLLVALVLGHDLLMAAEAVASPLPTGGWTHHGSEPHAGDADAFAWGHPGSTPEHPENCRIGQSAVARSADPFERTNQDLGAPEGSVGFPIDLVPRHEAFLWEEPHRPPGTLRAIFQVYRM